MEYEVARRGVESPLASRSKDQNLSSVLPPSTFETFSDGPWGKPLMPLSDYPSYQKRCWASIFRCTACDRTFKGQTSSHETFCQKSCGRKCKIRFENTVLLDRHNVFHIEKGINNARGIERGITSPQYGFDVRTSVVLRLSGLDGPVVRAVSPHLTGHLKIWVSMSVHGSEIN